VARAAPVAVHRNDQRNEINEDGIMITQTPQRNGLASLSTLTARRPERFALRFSIDVCGFDRCGHFFTERSETCDVSDGGCKFYLRTEVERDAVVALRVIDRSNRRGNDTSPVLFQVARIERESSGWALGALKLDAQDLWPMQAVPSRGELPSSD
jgi:hypothetical protein